MVTPDFEEWLRRQDFPIEATVTLERWLDYLEQELGIHGGSLDVAAGIYEEKYEVFAPVGIRPVTRRYQARGEWFEETRYVIPGRRGLWGRERALTWAETLAEAKGYYDIARRARELREHEFGG